MRLIALVGAKGCGKSTAAQILVADHGFTRLRFADGLKTMLVALGLTWEHIDGPLKEEPCALLGGKTPRWAMQSLGTEWGRDLISPDLWINVMRAEIVRVVAANPAAKIVIDDCRFPNEAVLMEELGGLIWRIRRPEVEIVLPAWRRALVRWGLSKKVHPSELYWPTFRADIEIDNDLSVTALAEGLRRAVRTVPVLRSGVAKKAA